RVEALPPEHEAQEVHDAAGEADDDACDDEPRAVHPEARHERPVRAHQPPEAEHHERLEVDEERRVERAGARHVAPRRPRHARDEEWGRAHDEERGRDAISREQRPAMPAQLEEGEHVVIEERRQRNDAEVDDGLPEQSTLGVRGGPQPEHADVPDGERERHAGERVMPAMAAVPCEGTAEEEEVQREREERDELVDARHAVGQKPKDGYRSRARCARIPSARMEKTRMSQRWPWYRCAARRTPSCWKPLRRSA